MDGPSPLPVVVVGSTISPNYKSIAFTLDATGTIIPAVVGKRIKVYAYKLFATVAQAAVNFRSGSSTPLEGSYSLIKDAPIPVIETVNPPAYLFATAVGQSLDLVISAKAVSGRISYWNDDAT